MPTLETAPATPTLMLEQSRIIRAPRERVYEAWTNPEILKRWFGNAAKYCPNAELDVREGGSYRIEVAPKDAAPAVSGNSCDQQTTAAFGHYTRIVPNELLQFTWASDWVPGEESLVTVTLMDARGGTQINIRHERFATEASRDAHNNGWAACLDKLESVSPQL